jgi:hypothetical protein
MKSHINLFSMLVLVCLPGLISVAFAQEVITVPEESVSPGDVNKPDVPPFPYVAQITGDNVNIRSGPGTDYYRCGQLNKADKVKVVGSQLGWSRIVPPVGSFSWISMQYVRIDPNDPAVGIVTGDGVRVYAGSDDEEPMHSTTLQLQLNRGDKVGLMDEQKNAYYKIAPPTGAYLWVSSKYVEPLGPVGEVPLIIEPPEEKVAPPTVVPTEISVEAKKLEEYRALQEQIQAQRAKPIPQQDYTKIKKALTEIANNKEAGKAARYAEFTLKQIDRYELALAVEKQVRLQDARLAQNRERIDRARTNRLAKVKDLGRFAVIGQFQTSAIYGPEPERIHYQIIDDSGKISKIICYALPTGPASEMDLSKFVGQKVGLVGKIEPHPQTASALVRFTEIVQLD